MKSCKQVKQIKPGYPPSTQGHNKCDGTGCDHEALPPTPPKLSSLEEYQVPCTYMRSKAGRYMLAMVIQVIQVQYTHVQEFIVSSRSNDNLTQGTIPPPPKGIATNWPPDPGIGSGVGETVGIGDALHRSHSAQLNAWTFNASTAEMIRMPMHQEQQSTQDQTTSHADSDMYKDA
uniref:Uncharacterized protein n=1 Tax=Eutreptiella gymnastica TaxID=73025 RepID=A0A7S1IB04_9EUGL|mmetsp:Transcript_143744/g.250905  ORF Transcript_143744/g.250905 Transcript_143744/m.250905 type:complete len:175 (+) Transcript_143744:170-694(+)